MSTNFTNYKNKDEFISFLSNCDELAFSKAIDYVNVKGFLEGMYDHLLFTQEDTLTEAMDYAKSSCASIREYLKDKYNIDFNDYYELSND